MRRNDQCNPTMMSWRMCTSSSLTKRISSNNCSRCTYEKFSKHNQRATIPPNMCRKNNRKWITDVINFKKNNQIRLQITTITDCFSSDLSFFSYLLNSLFLSLSLMSFSSQFSSLSALRCLSHLKCVSPFACLSLVSCLLLYSCHCLFHFFSFSAHLSHLKCPSLFSLSLLNESDHSFSQSV